MMRFWRRIFSRSPGFRLRILIVCRANITRSPFVERLMVKRIGERTPDIAGEIGLASAGVQAFRNAAPDPVMRYLAGRYGVDLMDHGSQPVTDRLIREADWVFTLQESYARQIRARFRGAEDKVHPLTRFGTSDLECTDWDVADPTGREAEAYERFASRAEEEVERILALMEGELLGIRDNLVFIGNPGVGKSTLGKQVAEALGLEFLDTDDLIEERQGCVLQDIVDQQGYQALRRLEEDVLLGVDAHRTVIATGGSAVYSTAAMSHLRQRGTLVWLRADAEVLAERIGDAGRRGLAKPGHQSLDDLFRERNALYARWAEWSVATDDPESDPAGIIGTRWAAAQQA